MKGLQPLFFRKVKCIQFHNTLGGGGEHLGNCLHFRGEERERATQQNSCTLWAQHIRQGQGVKSEEGVKGKKSRFRDFYMCRLFQHMVQCLKRDNKGHNRLSWSEKILILPFISAAHVEFHYMDLMTCECRLCLWPWQCWWTSPGVRMWCIVLFLRCTSSNVTAFVDLWSKNVTPLSRFIVHFAFPSYKILPKNILCHTHNSIQ